jgi:16S rRNA (cytosine1402-N4)-methyltransferase
MNISHTPVLLKESVDGLNIKAGGTYVDATYGGGGYSAEILSRLKEGKLFALDIDEDAAAGTTPADNFIFIHGNFRYLKNYLKYYNVKEADGIVADLGVSSHHFDSTARGFTYRQEAPLDMRMNLSSDITASKIINEYEESRLACIFRNYGELNQSARIASLISRARKTTPIRTNFELVECFKSVIPAKNANQFLSQVFQALRIEVNSELESLEIFLNHAGNSLKSGGRLVIVSYHSLEDRLVKNYMRWDDTRKEPLKDMFGNRPLKFRVITRKPVVPDENEIAANPRSRSAKLRIAEKI